MKLQMKLALTSKIKTAMCFGIHRPHLTCTRGNKRKGGSEDSKKFVVHSGDSTAVTKSIGKSKFHQIEDNVAVGNLLDL